MVDTFDIEGKPQEDGSVLFVFPQGYGYEDVKKISCTLHSTENKPINVNINSNNQGVR